MIEDLISFSILLDILLVIQFTAILYLISKNVVYPSLKKNFRPTVFQQIEKGDVVMVDVDREDCWGQIGGGRRIAGEDLGKRPLFFCDSKYRYLGDVWLRYIEDPGILIEVFNDEALIGLYKEKCESCGSKPVYNQRTNKYFCPFCNPDEGKGILSKVKRRLVRR